MSTVQAQLWVELGNTHAGKLLDRHDLKSEAACSGTFRLQAQKSGF